MFAYCNNNPLMNCDPDGEDPVLFAAAGGALAGGLVSLYFYTKTADDASVGGALLAMTGGVLAGALGGAAGVLMGNPRTLYVALATTVGGLISDATGGSPIVGALTTLVGTLLGCTIDISMYSGLELMFANFIASVGVGYTVELASQSMQEDINSAQTTSTQGTTPKGSGSRRSSGAGSTRTHICAHLN